MPNEQPIITEFGGRRKFACSAAAVSVFIVNEEEKILLLSHPKREGLWEIVSGALEAEETILQGCLRETREEIGSDLQVRPLGIVHAYTFSYDQKLQYMISVSYLLAFEGGRVQPGDDMAGSRFKWCSLEELEEEEVRIIVPNDRNWLMRRAVELYRLWRGQELDHHIEKDLKPGP